MKINQPGIAKIAACKGVATVEREKYCRDKESGDTFAQRGCREDIDFQPGIYDRQAGATFLRSVTSFFSLGNGDSADSRERTQQRQYGRSRWRQEGGGRGHSKMPRVNSVEGWISSWQISMGGRPRVRGGRQSAQIRMWVGSSASLHPPGYGRVPQSEHVFDALASSRTRSYATAAADRHASNLN